MIDPENESVKVTPKECATFRQQILDSNMPDGMKQQSLEGLSAIELTGGDLKAAIENIIGGLPEDQRKQIFGS